MSLFSFERFSSFLKENVGDVVSAELSFTNDGALNMVDLQMTETEMRRTILLDTGTFTEGDTEYLQSVAERHGLQCMRDVIHNTEEWEYLIGMLWESTEPDHQDYLRKYDDKGCVVEHFMLFCSDAATGSDAA